MIRTITFVAAIWTLTFTAAVAQQPAPPKAVTTSAIAIALPTREFADLSADDALERVLNGDAKIVAQTSIRTQSGQRARVECHRTHKFAVQMTRKGDSAALPGRCKVWPVGTSLEVDPLIREDRKTLDISIRLIFHFAEPKDPGLPAILKAMKKEDGTPQDVPRPQFSEIKQQAKLEAIKSGSLQLFVTDPPEGLDDGMKYAILVRATIIR